MTAQIRVAVPGDIPAIQSIGLLTWPVTYLPLSNPDFVLANLNSWWSREAVTQSVQEDTSFVAVHEQRIVGTLTLGEFQGEAVI